MNTEKIELFGYKLLLSERAAIDIFALDDFIPKLAGDAPSNLLYYATIVSDAVKINIKNLKWYQFYRKIKFKRLFTQSELIKRLSYQDIIDLTEIVFRLEGIESKKKVVVKSSAEL